VGLVSRRDTAEAANGTPNALLGVTATVDDAATLHAARGRDADAFRRLVEPHRRQLLLHCYRLLGSLTDAEDQLQETLLAAWLGLDRFEGEAGPALRAWLYRIATNRCLNARRDTARRYPPEPTPPFAPPEPTRRGETTWLQPYPDALLPDTEAAGPEARYEMRESVELAFVVALQRMPPRQAAVLVLRDVLGFSGADVARMLGTTATAVKGALQRARAALPPGRSPDAEAPAPPASAQERAVLARFVDAFTADDVDGVVALLTEDAWLAMPPAPHEYVGPKAIGAFLRAGIAWRPGRRPRLVPTRANGAPAFGCYLGQADDADGGGDDADSVAEASGRNDPDAAAARAAGLLVLTLAGGRIRGLTRFLDPDVFGSFGLAAHLPDHLAQGARAASTAASTCSRVVGNTGTGLSSGPTSISISVQPSTIPCAPAVTSRPMTSRYARRDSSRTMPRHSSS
jgi:RNA polymerase sigma-70 factor (TIGR02960 family)